MKGLSKLGIGLIVVFVVCLLLLVAEVFYVLWYRRRFRRNATVETDASGEPYTTTTTTKSSFTSKELMYLFCWNNQSRSEPASAPTAPSIDQEHQVPSSESDNPLKWHVLYGPSRLLFTIKEEEKEDLESVKSSTDRKPNPDKERKVSLSECFERTQEEDPGAETNSVAVDVEERESTPFSTPCASPPYYTPSPSPTRDAGGEEGGCFVSLNVHGR
ncbi:uncharacterized protein LOC122057115 [Macadamia integrifolia]|uniref:uncharacterized protein LOC122057115 n=1 Tax=Macadamia integrifolia TaxID=60698 RepID=UPI001C52E53C|nr:uncharacterized protein LOC122057115 [Macadamia integrifolia]